jgi:hypothetical protein
MSQKLKKSLLRIFGFAFFSFVLSSNGYNQKNLAVPNALGFAKYVRGAYAGSSNPTILYVDRLTDDSGNNGNNKGSLRWCLTRNYPRIILFEVSGYITLTTYIRVNNDYVSIYGQTAPSPGITVSGVDVVDFRCNYVVLQHLRFRSSYAGSSQIDAMSLTAGSNIFIDHCSFSYSGDECLGVSGTLGNNLTVQNCIFSWPLHYNTSKGMLVFSPNVDSVSILRSAFIHCADRTPFPNSPNYRAFETVNTISYNPAYYGQSYSGSNGANVSIIGNEWRPGPNSSGNREVVRIRTDMNINSKFYLHDNYSPKKVGNSDWNGVVYFEDNTKDSADFKASSPFAGFEKNYYSYKVLNDSITLNAGARPWDRDSADIIALKDMIEGTGHWITSQSEAYYPKLIENNVALEIPNNPNSDNDGNGFTNLEEWVYNMQHKPDTCLNLSVTGIVTNSGAGLSNGAIDITTTGGTLPHTYLWVDGPTSEDRTGLSSSTYTLTVSDKNGCSIEKSFQVIDKSVSSVNNQFRSADEVEISPNPANSVINVKLSKSSHVIITNINGVSFFDKNLPARVNHIYISYPAGNYIIIIKNDNKIVTRKQIVISSL